MNYFSVNKQIITNIKHYFLVCDGDLIISYYVKKKKISFPIKEGNKIITFEIPIQKYEKFQNDISFLSKSGSYFIPINGKANFIY